MEDKKFEQFEINNLDAEAINGLESKSFLSSIRKLVHNKVLMLSVLAGLAGSPACGGSMDEQTVSQVEQHEDLSPFTIFFLSNLADKKTGAPIGLSLNYRLPEEFRDVTVEIFREDGTSIYKESMDLNPGSDRIFFTENEIPGAREAYKVDVNIDGKIISGSLDINIDDGPIGQ